MRRVNGIQVLDYFTDTAEGAVFPTWAPALKRKAALKRGPSAAVNVAFHKMLVAATRGFTSANREDCFMNPRFQYSRCGASREVESF
jgi:hypothetical protein